MSQPTMGFQQSIHILPYSSKNYFELLASYWLPNFSEPQTFVGLTQLVFRILILLMVPLQLLQSSASYYFISKFSRFLASYWFLCSYSRSSAFYWSPTHYSRHSASYWFPAVTPDPRPFIGYQPIIPDTRPLIGFHPIVFDS
jgi:hypothetical protein